MQTVFKLKDEGNYSYGTFSTLTDAKEIAQEIATKLNKDIFIEKITVELVECVLPEWKLILNKMMSWFKNKKGEI